LSTSV